MCNSKNVSLYETTVFFGNQLAHITFIAMVWILNTDNHCLISEVIQLTYSIGKASLIFLGYVVVTWPVGYIIRFPLRRLADNLPEVEERKVEHGGKLIGIFERLIILTFMGTSNNPDKLAGNSILNFTG